MFSASKKLFLATDLHCTSLHGLFSTGLLDKLRDELKVPKYSSWHGRMSSVTLFCLFSYSLFVPLPCPSNPHRPILPSLHHSPPPLSSKDTQPSISSEIALHMIILTIRISRNKQVNASTMG